MSELELRNPNARHFELLPPAIHRTKGNSMSNSIVIFGASGDLTSRKLIPAIYNLFHKKRLPADTRIIGSARSKFTHEEFCAKLRETTKQFAGESFEDACWAEFSQSIFYQAGDMEQQADYQRLAKTLEDMEGGQEATRLYYLATAPRFYAPAIAGLGKAGMADESHGKRRVVIEKPFGTDLATAKELNIEVHQFFDESQVYRIDHYLGKETVQNIMILRFANTIFEPVWNRNYVDHVQITVAEEVPVGRRGGYYESAGILRDMFQNHLLQLLMVTAMEAPARYRADSVRDEKVKVLQAVRPMNGKDFALDTLRGQYKGYRQEQDVNPQSQTATYAAIKLWVDNWRWQGVPFYLRSGKAMSCRTSQIVIQFRQPPHLIFQTNKRVQVQSNRLVLQVQPNEGIQLHFQTKVPDAGMEMRLTDLDFSFRREFNHELPEAYERLLLDVMTGDASLFARADEVERAWTIMDPIMQAWNSPAAPELFQYEQGLWGPEEACQWMADQGRDWFDSCPVLR